MTVCQNFNIVKDWFFDFYNYDDRTEVKMSENILTYCHSTHSLM